LRDVTGCAYTLETRQRRLELAAIEQQSAQRQVRRQVIAVLLQGIPQGTPGRGACTHPAQCDAQLAPGARLGGCGTGTNSERRQANLPNANDFGAGCLGAPGRVGGAWVADRFW